MTVTINGPLPRESLKTLLEAEFPDWNIVTSQRAVDNVDRPTILLKQATIEPLAAAPNGQYAVGYTVTIVDPHQDIELAETALDENVLAVWAVLLTAKATNPKKATKVLFNQYLAYDIETDLWVQIQKGPVR